MNYPYLSDTTFLKYIDLQKLKEQLIKITILDWEEKPIQDLTGKAIGGSINIDGKSNMRRTANISVFISAHDSQITNPDNFLSINKKISIEIGIKNITNEYQDFPVLWFPMGLYIIKQMGISHSMSGLTLNLTLADKMCLLNGECGGVIPAAVNFSERERYSDTGEIIIEKPTIYQIITELVNHWGGEQLGKIIISDLDTRIKKVMQWTGSIPLYCYKVYQKNIGKNDCVYTTNLNDLTNIPGIAKNDITTIFCQTLLEMNNISEEDYKGKNICVKYLQYKNGEDVGYIYTDFVYPGNDLIGDIGNSVCDILEQIRSLLGNYEYFYDLNGNFIFREIKNYLNISKSTLDIQNLQNKDYLLDQTEGTSVYDFDNNNLIMAYSNSPQFNMIKNDFLVWGQRKTTDGKTLPIRYHLSIDKKPNIDLQGHEVVVVTDSSDGLRKARPLDLLPQELSTPGEPDIYYKQNDKIYKWNLKEKKYEECPDLKSEIIVAKDWRTELYLQGVESEKNATYSNDYYVELKNEWPKLYDIFSDKPDFNTNFQTTPSNCDFFLDFIDSDAAIGILNISNIGKRTKVLVDDKINCLFAPEIPDLILLKTSEASELEKKKEECNKRGQNFTQVNDNVYNYLAGGGKANSAYDAVRDLLYQYTNYNESISLQCMPIYYLDVNTRIGVRDAKSNINGEYMICSISLPLDISSAMSITAVKALERI